jgi:N-ethylmaleimide reductase
MTADIKNLRDFTRERLFAPFRLGPNRLANRFVMAPMTRNRANDENAAHALTARYYEQRASAGLIITEGSQISPQGKGYPRTPGIYSTVQIAGWQHVTKAVHGAGGRIFLQLWHVGRISHPSIQPGGLLPVAPSAIAPQGTLYTGATAVPFVTPRALTVTEIAAVVDDYAAAAVNAREAGFDGVEIHAANGYLIDQFLRDGTNHRDDAFGGSIEKRARFLLDIVHAVTAVWGSERVGVRLSPVNPFNDMTDSDPQRSFNYFAAALSPFGLAYLHAIETPNTTFDWSAFRRRYKGIYIANGGYDLSRARTAIDTGHADLVALGALFLANPDLVERLRRGGPLNTPNRATFYGGNERGYTDYPFLGESAIAR